jgi:hypothetical protein
MQKYEAQQCALKWLKREKPTYCREKTKINSITTFPKKTLLAPRIFSKKIFTQKNTEKHKKINTFFQIIPTFIIEIQNIAFVPLLHSENLLQYHGLLGKTHT